MVDKRLTEALAFADLAVKTAEREYFEGRSALLYTMPEPLRHYYASVHGVLKAHDPAVWAALYPAKAQALLEIHHSYNMLTRLAEVSIPARLAKMTLDEIAGLVRYIEDQLKAKTQLQQTIAGMAPEELRDLLQKVQDELTARRKAEAAQQEGKAPTTGALTEALTDLSRDIKGSKNGH